MKNISIFLDECGYLFWATGIIIKSVNSYLDLLGQSEEFTRVSLYTFNARTGLRARFTDEHAKYTRRLFSNSDLFANPYLDRNQIYAPTGKRRWFFGPKELTSRGWFATLEL